MKEMVCMIVEFPHETSQLTEPAAHSENNSAWSRITCKLVTVPQSLQLAANRTPPARVNMETNLWRESLSARLPHAVAATRSAQPQHSF